MNIIFDIAEVRISETHTQRVEVPRWEIPILKVIHEGNVKVIGQTIVSRPIPDPAAEFQRLAARYGPKNEDVPAVAAVYGNFGPGTKALREAIRDSLTSAPVTPADTRSVTQIKRDDDKAASASGNSIEQEALAIETAAAKQDPAEVVDNDQPSNNAEAQLQADITALTG